VLFFIQRTCEELAVDAIKTGFLLKGENRDGNTSRLKKRYFVLHPRLLYYFTGDRGSNTPAEILPLEYYSIGELQTRDGQEEGNTGLLFFVMLIIVLPVAIEQSQADFLEQQT